MTAWELVLETCWIICPPLFDPRQLRSFSSVRVLRFTVLTYLTGFTNVPCPGNSTRHNRNWCFGQDIYDLAD
jgi:hypothetical protein